MFKELFLCHRAVYAQGPSYLCSKFISYLTFCNFHASFIFLLQVPKIQMTYIGGRLFYFLASGGWNPLRFLHVLKLSFATDLKHFLLPVPSRDRHSAIQSRSHQEALGVAVPLSVYIIIIIKLVCVYMCQTALVVALDLTSALTESLYEEEE